MKKVEAKTKTKYSLLLSNTMIFAIGSIGSKLITFLLVPLYTNVLTTEQYGTADLVTTCSNIIVPILSLVIQDAVLRFGLSNENDNSEVLKNAILIIGIGSILALAFVPAFGLYEPIKQWKFYLFATSISTMLSNVIFAYTKAVEKNKLYSLASILNAFLLAAANFIFLAVMHMGVEGYLLANIIGQVVTSLILILFTKATNAILFGKVNVRLLKQMIAYSLPLIVNNLSWWVLSSSDRIMVEHYCSVADLGLYTAAAKIPALLSVVTSIFSQAWTVSAVKEYDGENDKKFYAVVFDLFCFCIMVCAALVVLVTKPFMSIYVGDTFFVAWKLVPLLVFGAVFFAISSFFGAIYGALKKNKNVALTTLIAAVVNILINIILLPYIGVIAASISTAVGYFVIGIYRMIDSQKMYRFSINYIKLILETLLLLGQVILVTCSYHIYTVSIIAVVLIIAVNYKNIIQLYGYIGKIYKKDLNCNG